MLERPPLIKLYEALGAVGGGRVKIEDQQHARVTSSDAAKTYDVMWSLDRRSFTSNDNGTYWRGYVGYPICAVLISLGSLRVTMLRAAGVLADVPWKHLNDLYADYDRVINYVLEGLHPRDASDLREEVSRMYDDLMALRLRKLDEPRFELPALPH